VVAAELKSAMLHALFRHIRRIRDDRKDSDVYDMPVWSVLAQLSPNDVRSEIGAILNDLRSSTSVIGKLTHTATRLGLSDELKMFVQNEKACIFMREHACPSPLQAPRRGSDSHIFTEHFDERRAPPYQAIRSQIGGHLPV
jgi:hypothetical protein